MTSEIEQTTAAILLRLGQSRQWPGERVPDRFDVDEANRALNANVVERFKAALLHAEDDSLTTDADVAAETAKLELCIDRALASRLDRPYTYPMALLTEVPALPSSEELSRLQNTFDLVFIQHIYVRDLAIGSSQSSSTPPYLQLALACMASVFAPSLITEVARSDLPEASANLYLAGVDVWSIMLEVQNTEARTLDAVHSAAILATYGTLTSDTAIWKKTTFLICNAATISRRIHLTDGHFALQIAGGSMERDARKRSSLICYLLLVDVLHSLHHGTPPNYSSSELFIKMPVANQSFRAVYNSLLHGHGLSNLSSYEDALVLIVTLVNDILYNQYSHVGLDTSSPPHSSSPMSADRDFSHRRRVLEAGLHRWERAFPIPSSPSNVLVLYYLAHILLKSPRMLDLPGTLGQNGPIELMSHEAIHEVCSEAVDSAWKLLEAVERSLESYGYRISIWLPIGTFIAGLVVWSYHTTSEVDMRYGGLKSLSLYENALSQMPWPCCVEMAQTLGRLRAC